MFADSRHPLLVLCLAALLLALGCGDAGGSTPEQAKAEDGAAGAGEGGLDTMMGELSDMGDAMRAATDDGPIDYVGDPSDPRTPEDIDCPGFVIDEGSFSVEPGGNVNYCVRVPLPEAYRGRDLALYGWSWNLQAGTHHYFMEYSPNPYENYAKDGEPYVPCNGSSPFGTFSLLSSTNSEGSKIVFGAGEGKDVYLMDPDRGKYLVKDGHFRTSHHVLNFTEKPMDVSARFKVCIRDAEQTRYLVNSFVCTTTSINVPAGETGQTTGTCRAPYDMDLVLVASHAHQHLTKFEQRICRDQGAGKPCLPDEEPFYVSDDWDSPDIVYQKPFISLKKGDGITFTCYYQADPDKPVLFGDRETDEHCAAYNGYSYPKDQPFEIPPPLFGVTLFQNGQAYASDSRTGLAATSPL